MVGGVFNLTGEHAIEALGDFSRRVQLVYPTGHQLAGQPVNLSIYTSFEGELREERDTSGTFPILAQISFEVVNATQGTADLNIDGRSILNTWPLRGVYDLYGVRGSGDAVRLFEGEFELRPAATDPYT